MNIHPEILKGMLQFVLIGSVFMWSIGMMTAQLLKWNASWILWAAYLISFVFAGVIGALLYAYNIKQ